MGKIVQKVGMSAGVAGRHTLITAEGVRIILQPMPHSQCVAFITHDRQECKLHQTLIPLDMVGAVSVALTAAAQTVARRIPMRCHDTNACKAGMQACPTRHACGQAEDVELGTVS